MRFFESVSSVDCLRVALLADHLLSKPYLEGVAIRIDLGIAEITLQLHGESSLVGIEDPSLLRFPRPLKCHTRASALKALADLTNSFS
jgi:hypothetical protein